MKILSQYFIQNNFYNNYLQFRMSDSNYSYQDYFPKDYDLDGYKLDFQLSKSSSNRITPRLQQIKMLENSFEGNKACSQQNIGESQTENQGIKPARFIQLNSINIELSFQRIKQYEIVKKGSPKQTNQLNINLKTVTSRLLIKGIMLRYYQQEQKSIIQQFIRSGYNFEDMILLFNKSQKIRKNCKKHYTSTEFIKQIMSSSQMLFKNKLICIKYLPVVCQNVTYPNRARRWKNKNSIISSNQIYIKNTKYLNFH